MANKPRSKQRAQSRITQIKAEVATSSELIARAKKKADDTNSAHLSELLKMFARTQFLCRQLELRCKTDLNTRDIYALATLYSQQREIIADIRSVSDMSSQVDTILSKVLQPAASSQAQLITNMFYHLRKLIAETSAPKQTDFALRQLETVLKDLANGTQQNFEVISEKIRSVLME